MSFREQPLCKIRSNKTGNPGDQTAHRFSFIFVREQNLHHVYLPFAHCCYASENGHLTSKLCPRTPFGIATVGNHPPAPFETSEFRSYDQCIRIIALRPNL